jgi:ABC-2 type transport system permease protein
MRAIMSQVERELLRFFRQRSRVIGAMLQPVIFWVLFSAGLRNSVAGGNYTQFLLPGMAALIVMFTAIFSTISIIRDRGEGFLQGVLVAPVPRSSIVWGKVLGGTILSVLQGVIFLLLGSIVGHTMSPLELIGVIGVLGLMGLGLTAMGFVLAWPMDSIQGFHAIMSLILFPMWLLSGAIFPVKDLDPWFEIVVKLNPLTYGVEALRHAAGLGGTSMSLATCLLVFAGFTVVMLMLSVRMAGRPAKGDLR